MYNAWFLESMTRIGSATSADPKGFSSGWQNNSVINDINEKAIWLGPAIFFIRYLSKDPSHPCFTYAL
jgi:hypothetical protein